MSRPSRDAVQGSRDYIFVKAQLDQEQNEGRESAGSEPKVSELEKQQRGKDLLNKLLSAAGREALREKTPSLAELELSLQNATSSLKDKPFSQSSGTGGDSADKGLQGQGMPLVTYLMQKGYLRDSPKWLSPKGFVGIGNRILSDIMKSLKQGEYGLHETQNYGTGSITLDTSKKFEPGDDIRLLDVPRSLLNCIQRTISRDESINLPLQMDVDDFEEYETMQDVRVSVVYCIDLSSTMRYSSMYGDMSRIEAAKRALWSLYLLNKKFFPSDSIYIVGFGALASKVLPLDIPYLKTFEPGSDFLHYTNYQAAFRLASRLLQKDGAMNKRIVLVTDGHPSACFIDDKDEQDKILSQRPYSHFYSPDKQTLDSVKEIQSMNLDMTSGQLVYLCYRYRQVDQYIGERTIVEAKKCKSQNIDVDTIMISEEDSLLGYVNEMEKYVRGRSYYINPSEIDKVLLTDYISNKKQRAIKSGPQW